MVTDEGYERCLWTIEREHVGSDARAERLEQLFQATPFSLDGQELEDAVLEALWLWQSYSTNRRLPQRPIRRLLARHGNQTPTRTAANTLRPCDDYRSTPDSCLGVNGTLAKSWWLEPSQLRHHSQSRSPRSVDTCPSTPSTVSTVSSTIDDSSPSAIHSNSIEDEDLSVAIMDDLEVKMDGYHISSSPLTGPCGVYINEHDSPKCKYGTKISGPTRHQFQRTNIRGVFDRSFCTPSDQVGSNRAMDSRHDVRSNMPIHGHPSLRKPESCISVAFDVIKRFATVPSPEDRPRMILTKAEAKKRAVRRETKEWEVG